MSAESKTGNIRVNISSGEELARALRHPDIKVRTMVLRAIKDKPDQAMAYKMASGRDLIDELLQLCRETCGNMDRLGYVFTLLNLDDPRVLDFAGREFVSTDNMKIALLCATRLGKLSPREKIALLSPVVLNPCSATRGRMAANLLSSCKPLPPRLAIRVAILGDREISLPALNAAHLEAWLAELSGPYPQTARKLLIKQGNGGIDALLSLWDRLPENLQIWTLDQGTANKIPGISSRICEIFQKETSPELLRAALECLGKFPVDHGAKKLLIPFYGHENSLIRSLAISAGPAEGDWSALFETETSLKVRLAIIKRMGDCGNLCHVNRLIRLLEDPGWRIRSQAAAALVNLAPASLPGLRESLKSSSNDARVAAAQALYQLGQQEWVQGDLSPGNA